MIYTELLNNLKGFIGNPKNPDILNALPNCITNANYYLSRKLSVLGLQETKTGTLPANQFILEKPQRWTRTISLTLIAGVGNIINLTPRSREYCNAVNYNNTDLSDYAGKPRNYADFNQFTNLYISPAPSSDYSYELIYHVLYFPLGDSNQSNFLTEKYSDVLMDCCLYFFYKQVQMNLSFAEFYKNEVLAGVQDIISNDQMNKTDRQSNTEIS